MKKFSFSLQTVLDLRERKLNEEIKLMSAIVSRINSYHAQIAENKLEIAKIYKAFDTMLQEKTDSSLYRSYEMYLKRHYYEIDASYTSIDKLTPELNEARKKVADSRKNLKVIEILKEKKWMEFTEKLSKAERLEVEEYNQKRSEGEIIYSDTEGVEKAVVRKQSEEEDAEDEVEIKKKSYADEILEKYGKAN